MTAVRGLTPKLLALALSTLGCGSGGGRGASATEASGCVTIATSSLAWSERSALGFSADELLGTLGSERETRFVHAGGASTGLHLRLTRASGNVSLQRREPEAAEPSTPASRGSGCGDVVSVPVTLSFTTDDGAFDEVWSVALMAEDAAHASGQARLDLLDLGGSYSTSELDPSAFDALVGQLQIELGAPTWTGELSGQALESASDGSGQGFEIGTF